MYRRLRHLEQYLFLVEKMIPFFSYSQGKKLISVFEKLLDQGNMNGDHSSKVRKSENLENKNWIDKLENNFLIYSTSPVKDWVLIMYVWKQLEEVHLDLAYLDHLIYEKYSKLVNKIIDATESMKDVYSLLTDKCFNKKEVIDIISSSDLQIILNNSKVGRVVSDFWTGPFETEFFMNSCMVYQEFYHMFIGGKKFLDYKPQTKYRYSISNLWRGIRVNPTEKKKMKRRPK